MKHVAMLYQNADNMTAINHIESTIMQIFSGEIAIDRYILDEIDERQSIVADAYILNGERLLYQIRYHLKDTRNMIILNRSIFKEHLAELLKIPVGTDALVVNDTPVSTAETLYMFYRLGITHLNLVLYDPELLSSGIYDHIEYAITPSEPQLVPSHIKHVINTGYREVGFDTLLNLAERLQLDSEQVMGRLMSYFERITEPNMGAHSTYLDSYIKDHIINELIADSFAALLAFSADGRLIYENDKAKALFADEEMPDLSGEDVHNAVITINGSNLLMDRKAIDIGGVHTGYTVSLQDEKSIREVEGLFNKKLKGQPLEVIDVPLEEYLINEMKYSVKVIKPIIEQIKKVLQEERQLYLEGANKAFDLPEFNSLEVAKNFVNIIDEKELMADMLDSGFAKDINVYIGDENEKEQLKDFSVITFKHRVGNRDLGTIGIIGPKRMDYSKVISVMKYINKKLNEKDM